MTDSPLNRRAFLQTAAALAAGAAGTALTGSAHAQQQASDSAASPSPSSTKKSGWKKAVKYTMLPRNLSDEARLTLAKECGFDGVEGEPIEDLDQAQKLAELARKIGVPFHGLVFGGWHAPLSSPDPEVRRKGVEGMKHALRCARVMGVETVLLVPAVVTEQVRYKDAWERSQQHIRELIPVAEQEKVYICVENVWNKFLLSPLEFARYVDEFESPWVRAYYDTANSIVQGYSEDWIRTLGKRIRKCDVKDFSRKQHRFVDLGDGDVNWPEVRKAFREIGYDDYLTAETGEQTKEQLLEISRRMDQILAE